MQLVNLLTELSWVNAGDSFGADGGACLHGVTALLFFLAYSGLWVPTCLALS